MFQQNKRIVNRPLKCIKCCVRHEYGSHNNVIFWLKWSLQLKFITDSVLEFLLSHVFLSSLFKSVYKISFYISQKKKKKNPKVLKFHKKMLQKISLSINYLHILMFKILSIITQVGWPSGWTLDFKVLVSSLTGCTPQFESMFLHFGKNPLDQRFTLIGPIHHEQ